MDFLKGAVVGHRNHHNYSSSRRRPGPITISGSSEAGEERGDKPFA
jgi:hypothetical protein